jgi:4-amino-4-deoxy-L-arabinose transferase-like glycosyltransferase
VNSVLSGWAEALTQTAPAHYERLLVAVLVPLTLLRWLLAASFELSGDEAYYWLWSRYLDLAYYSKSPVVALVIATATHLFGDSSIGVRAFVPLQAAATTAGVFVLGRMLYDSRIGFWAAVLVSVMPMTAAGGLLQTIDPLSLCCCTWSLVVLARLTAVRSAGLWVAAGLLIGAGALAKYTNLFLLPGFALFCLLFRDRRALLGSGGFWLMSAVVLACLAPVLLWQSAHGWVTVTHLTERSAFGVTPQLSAGEFATYLGLQLAVSFPVLAAAVLAIPVLRKEPGAAAQGGAQSAPLTFLLALSLPPFASYAAMSWIKAGEANWVAPSYLGLAVVAAAGAVRGWQQPRAAAWPRWAWLLRCTSWCCSSPMSPYPQTLQRSPASMAALSSARAS